MTNSTKVTAVRTTAILVTDQDRQLAFYTDQLGLAVRWDQYMEQLNGRWIDLVPDGGDQATPGIALVPANGGPTGVDTGIRLAVGDAKALHADLSAAGVDVGELLVWPGVPPMFALTDPEGNRVYIVE